MNLCQLTDLMAGHIAKPYTEEEIFTILDDGEYSAELMLQHVLLLWKRTSSQRDELLEALEAMLDLWQKVGGNDTDWAVEKSEAAIASVKEEKP